MDRSSTSRRRAVRQVTRAEQTISAAILALLVLIAGFVVWKGGRYDPALFALDQSLLQDGATNAAAGRRAQVLPVEVEGLGWNPAGEVETFTADTLYVKINGRAEQYIQYGVVGLEVQSYTPGDGSDGFIDIFVYDMGSPLQAFGMFSAERTPGRERIDVGEQGYRSGPNLFFWQGPVYVQLLTGAETPALREAADRLAQQVAAALPRTAAGLWPLRVWNGPPWESETLQYQRRNALTLDFLHHAFTIHREGDPETARAFLSLRTDGQEAEDLWARFIDYYQSYGDIHRQQSAEGAEWLIADIAGFYDGLYRRGPLLAGVAGYEDGEAAAGRLAELREHLQAVPETLWAEVLPEWRQVLAATAEEEPEEGGGEEEGYWKGYPEGD